MVTKRSHILKGLKKLWKVEHVLICLQHRSIDLVKHGWHFPLLNFFTFKIFLLSKTLLPPIMSLRFLFLLNAKTGGSAKISFKFGSICKTCQFLSIIVLRSGRVLLYVTVSGKRSVLDVHGWNSTVHLRCSICFIVTPLR